MRGINVTQTSGTVADIISDTTPQGVACISFRLNIVGRNDFETDIRCNGYGPKILTMCEGMAAGDYVIVVGELMKRSGNLTEIRIQNIVPVNSSMMTNDDGESQYE